MIAGQAAQLKVRIGVHLPDIDPLGTRIVTNVKDGDEEVKRMVDRRLRFELGQPLRAGEVLGRGARDGVSKPINKGTRGMCERRLTAAGPPLTSVLNRARRLNPIRRCSLRACIALAAFLVGCSGSKPPGEPTQDPACPVEEAVRPFLERLVLDVVRNMAWVGGITHVGEIGSALTPFGFSGIASRFTLAVGCAGPATYAPFCSPRPEFDPFAFCHRGRCERAGVWGVDTYLVRKPHLDPDDRHRLEYDSGTFPGHVVYALNPLVTYRIYETTPGVVRVTSDIQDDLQFTPQGRGPVDLSHAGRVSYVRIGDEIHQFLVTVTFSGLSAGRPVTVQMELNSDGIPSGTVTASGRRIATIIGRDHSLTTGPTYTWVGDCGSDPAAGP